MRKNIFVISTILLGIVVVALLFTIATLQSENDKLLMQYVQTSEMDRYYNNLIARGMYADDSMYLDKSNTSEHEIIPYNMLTGRSSLLQDCICER